MKFTNGWRYVHKESDRLRITLRIGVFTIFEVFADASDCAWYVTILNFKVGNK